MVVGVAAENDHRFPEKEFTLSWAQWIDPIGKPSFVAGGSSISGEVLNNNWQWPISCEESQSLTLGDAIVQ